MKNIYTILTLLLSIFICAYSFDNVKRHDSELVLPASQELLYFPSGENLSLASLGFSNALANYLWFNTVSYFGKHYRTDQDYYWLGHMCNVITDLDAQHKEIYEFCALLLSWEAGDPDTAQKILTKGINKTNYWRFYYFRGMNSSMFYKNQGLARNDFIAAANLPNTPAFVHRLAAKTIAESEDPRNAINFLAEMIERAEDSAQRDALTKHYRKAVHEYNFISLEKYLKIYQDRYDQIPKDIRELIKVGASKNLFQDPFGGHYFLTKKGQIKSSSKVARISLFKNKENE